MDFFQERKLLVAWRRTNEISGENLTNVFARTYTRRRIAPIPVQSFQSFRNFREKLGADRNGRGKKKRKRKKSIPPLVSRRLEIISSWTGDSATIPETDLISWISPALKRTTDGEKGRKSRESRVARVSSSPDFSAPPLRPGCGRIAYRG